MTRFKYHLLILLLTQSIFICCNENRNSKSLSQSKLSLVDSTRKLEAVTQEKVKPKFSYHFVKKKDWQSQEDSFVGIKHLDLLAAINRVDKTHLKWLDSILVPNDFTKPLQDYMPFPDSIALLGNISKIVLFSYPSQSFAAYQNGKIILTGPTNMGRKSKQTPEGLFFTNWKAVKTRSTIDNSWILKWNFNIQNKLGVGFHQYALPGYPASHSCLRLSEEDARFLYNWADQWILKNNQLEASGTPVIVFGKYPFGKTKPWNHLVQKPDTLTISKDSINNIIQPHLQKILEKQKQRELVLAQQKSNPTLTQK